MRDVGLTFPVYITVRNSGDALVTIATSLDPSDADWQQASAIVCRTFEERVGCGSVARTRTRLRYCERGGDKCSRRDGRLIRRVATRDGFARLLAFLQPDGVLIVTIFVAADNQCAAFAVTIRPIQLSWLLESVLHLDPLPTPWRGGASGSAS